MLFNSLAFLIFFTIVCALMALTNLPAVNAMPRERRLRLRHLLLLSASYVFYGWWDWRFCFLMLGLTLVAHVCALQMDTPRRKTALVLGVVIPLGILGIFKYYNFFVDSFCAAFGIARAGTLRILLPVGISFYTFQSLSYTIDVYRGRTSSAPRSTSPFFPSLWRGPSSRPGTFCPSCGTSATSP